MTILPMPGPGHAPPFVPPWLSDPIHTWPMPEPMGDTMAKSKINWTPLDSVSGLARNPEVTGVDGYAGIPSTPDEIAQQRALISISLQRDELRRASQ